MGLRILGGGGGGTVKEVAGLTPDANGAIAPTVADIPYAADIRDKVQSTTGTSEVKFPTEKALATEKTRAETAEALKASKTELGTETTRAEAAESTEKTRAEAAELAAKKAAAGAYHRLYVNSGRITEAAESGKKYILATVSNVQKVESSSGVLSFFRLVAADLAVSGLTAKLKLHVTAAVFATAPNVTITVGLVPLAAGATMTPGSFVAGSEITITTPAKETTGLFESADFTLPSDGAYGIGYTVSGTPAASGSVILNGAVLAHAV